MKQIGLKKRQSVMRLQMDKYQATILWWCFISFLFFGLVIEVLFLEKYHALWLLPGALCLVVGMYLPLQDEEVRKRYTGE